MLQPTANMLTEGSPRVGAGQYLKPPNPLSPWVSPMPFQRPPRYSPTARHHSSGRFYISPHPFTTLREDSTIAPISRGGNRSTAEREI